VRRVRCESEVSCLGNGSRGDGGSKWSDGSRQSGVGNANEYP
jgi:hypothetical protein